jgi:hypothetical protein
MPFVFVQRPESVRGVGCLIFCKSLLNITSEPTCRLLPPIDLTLKEVSNMEIKLM